MKYEDMSPQQKRDFGFIKLNKAEIEFVTQSPNSQSEQIGASRSHLKLIKNDEKIS